jgi:hypothetical protein
VQLHRWDDEDRAYEAHVAVVAELEEGVDEYDARWDFAPAPLLSLVHHDELELIPFEGDEPEFVTETFAAIGRDAFRRGVLAGVAVAFLVSMFIAYAVTTWLVATTAGGF